MIAINYRDPRPIYEQIQAELRRLMLTGALPPGSRLPSVRELAGQQKKEALNAFRAAAQRLRALGLSAEALASLLTQEEPTDD